MTFFGLARPHSCAAAKCRPRSFLQLSATPFIALHDSAGIGKSTLLQLAAMRALVLGESVLMHACNESQLIELVDDELLRVERDGRWSAENAVVCVDSPKGFHHAFGRCDVFRKTLIVHAPSGDLARQHEPGRRRALAALHAAAARRAGGAGRARGRRRRRGAPPRRPLRPDHPPHRQRALGRAHFAIRRQRPGAAACFTCTIRGGSSEWMASR